VRTMKRSRSLTAAGATLIAGAVLPLFAISAAPAIAAGTGNSGDDRAASYDGNVTKCNANDATGEGNLPAEVPGQTITNKVTATVDSPNITITAVDSGWVVTGVVVKGGDGYNVYLRADLGALPWVDLHAPLNPNNEPAGISHWFVCGNSVPTTTAPPTTEPPTTEPPTTEPPTTEPPTTEPPTTEPPTTAPPTTTGTGGGGGEGEGTPPPTTPGVLGVKLAATGSNASGMIGLSLFLLAAGTAMMLIGRGRGAHEAS
jgi:hypothetical protein